MLDIEKRLKTLPILPEKVNQLLNLKYEKNYDTKKLLELIEQDAILTTRLLQLANSKEFGFLNPIYTPGRALSLYGMNFTIAVCVVELMLNSLKFNLSAYGISYLEFRRVCDSCFKLLFDWLDESQADLKEKLIIPLFIQHIGKFLISDFLESQSKSASFRTLINESNISKIEKDFTGLSSSELSSLILKKWGLTKELVDMVFYIDTPMFLGVEVEDINILNVINQASSFNKPFALENMQSAVNKAIEVDLDVKKLRVLLENILKEYNKN